MPDRDHGWVSLQNRSRARYRGLYPLHMHRPIPTHGNGAITTSQHGGHKTRYLFKSLLYRFSSSFVSKGDMERVHVSCGKDWTEIVSRAINTFTPSPYGKQ